MNSRRLLTVLILGLGLVAISSPAAVWAQNAADADVSVHISQESATMVAGDWVEFTTLLRNDGEETTPELVAHLNIAAVKKGRYVDPEDWSPERTIYVSPLRPGGSVELAWRVHALVEGEFSSFVSVVSPDASFTPSVSRSLLLRVSPDNILPMNEVIPVVAIVPVFPLALVLWNMVQRRRRPPPAMPRIS